jgi:hypothetical protein
MIDGQDSFLTPWRSRSDPSKFGHQWMLDVAEVYLEPWQCNPEIVDQTADGGPTTDMSLSGRFYRGHHTLRLPLLEKPDDS